MSFPRVHGAVLPTALARFATLRLLLFSPRSLFTRMYNKPVSQCTTSTTTPTCFVMVGRRNRDDAGVDWSGSERMLDRERRVQCSSSTFVRALIVIQVERIARTCTQARLLSSLASLTALYVAIEQEHCSNVQK